MFKTEWKKVKFAIASEEKQILPICRERFQQEQKYMEEMDLLINSVQQTPLLDVGKTWSPWLSL